MPYREIEARCRRCGQTQKVSICKDDQIQRRIEAEIRGEAIDDSFWPHGLMTQHNCDDAGIGIADVIGFAPIQAGANAPSGTETGA